MCGIVGILGKSAVSAPIVEALRRLEYRGYDSAGVATLEDGKIMRRRAPGKLNNLDEVLSKKPLAGHVGIGHTRWATHGRPNETNAHPHATERVAIVHNGIIENFRELREEAIAKGARIESETDTEVVAHLVTQALAQGKTPKEAVASTLKRLRGAFALAFLFSGEEDLLIGARRGPPLAVGYGEGEMYLGSDAIALAPLTNKISYLEEDDFVVLNHVGAAFFNAEGLPVKRPITLSQLSGNLVDKGNYRHFMAKEIHEQPEVVSHTLGQYLDLATGTVASATLEAVDFAKLSRLAISACGTAFYAGLVGRYWFERYARLPVDIDIASEFRYREAPLDPGGLALMISQSGETADTLATLRYCRSASLKIGSIVNVPSSTMARESDVIFRTHAGPEIGVASTKAFTCQIAALAALAIAAGKARGHIDAAAEKELVGALIEVPRLMAETLQLELTIERLSKNLSKASDVLYLGRGTSFPIALEGALKLKEISYIHAEGYAAGELKHGPIALIDENMPVVVVAPFDHLFEKTVSNMQEVAARGGKVILITDERGAEEAGDVYARIVVPTAHPFVSPLIYAIPVQLMAYHTAVIMGTDVDQPRSLAKSVTVE